jgi:branched-chain amino acid transport system ATP-binding protein
MLDVSGLEASYGSCQVLFGVDLRVGAGEVVTLLGRNGMGKTTTVRSIMGILPTRSGKIRFAGTAIERLPSYRIAKTGLGLVPEGRHVFANLTVRENLMATAANRSAATNPWTLDTVLDLFPSLARRLTHYGTQLSGGEQQMVAIGRALMTNPRLLILDEATEGLAPLIRGEIWRCLERLKSLGQAILLIDKNIDALGRIADRHYIVEKGRIVWHGRSGELMGDPSIRQRYLGV